MEVTINVEKSVTETVTITVDNLEHLKKLATNPEELDAYIQSQHKEYKEACGDVLDVIYEIPELDFRGNEDDFGTCIILYSTHEDKSNNPEYSPLSIIGEKTIYIRKEVIPLCSPNTGLDRANPRKGETVLNTLPFEEHEEHEYEWTK